MNFNQLDSKELESIGIRFATERETLTFAAILREELEYRIGGEISKGFSEKELEVFDRCETREEAARWLRRNCPDYVNIVEKERNKLERELIEYRSKIPGLVAKG